jgi:hypothetical protein
VDYENLGGLAAHYWFTSGEVVFGEEWRPIDDEKRQIPAAFTAYFRAKEIGDIPPGVALVLALSMYTTARIARPTVRERIAGFGGWIKGRWNKWRGRK